MFWCHDVKIKVVVMEGSEEEFFSQTAWCFWLSAKNIYNLSGSGRCLHTQKFPENQKRRSRIRWNILQERKIDPIVPRHKWTALFYMQGVDRERGGGHKQTREKNKKERKTDPSHHSLFTTICAVTGQSETRVGKAAGEIISCSGLDVKFS